MGETTKRRVDDMSGFCRFPDRSGDSHRHCHGSWVTPSAEVTCVCSCHMGTTEVRRMVPKHLNGKSARVLVPKK